MSVYSLFPKGSFYHVCIGFKGLHYFNSITVFFISHKQFKRIFYVYSPFITDRPPVTHRLRKCNPWPWSYLLSPALTFGRILCNAMHRCHKHRKTTHPGGRSKHPKHECCIDRKEKNLFKNKKTHIFLLTACRMLISNIRKELGKISRKPVAVSRKRTLFLYRHWCKETIQLKESWFGKRLTSSGMFTMPAAMKLKHDALHSPSGMHGECASRKCSA